MDEVEEIREENQRLDTALDGFVWAMKGKLFTQAEKGYRGWDDRSPENKEFLEARLKQHLEKGLGKDNLVDISNFCFFLWYLETVGLQE